MRDLHKDLEICENATPGPWEWRGNTKGKSLVLISCVGMRDIIMDFARWGMQSAQPRFNENGLLENATKFMRPRYDHHPTFDLDICHPNAQFIAEARQGWSEAIQRAIAAEQRVKELEEALKSATKDLDIFVRYCCERDKALIQNERTANYKKLLED